MSNTYVYVIEQIFQIQEIKKERKKTPQITKTQTCLVLLFSLFLCRYHVNVISMIYLFIFHIPTHVFKVFYPFTKSFKFAKSICKQ